MRKIATDLTPPRDRRRCRIGGVAAASDGTGAPQERTAGADSRIVRELDDVNSTLKPINKNLGGYDNIATSPASRQPGGRPTAAGSYRSARRGRGRTRRCVANFVERLVDGGRRRMGTIGH
ncbi:MAG TPA: hypothetical protein VGO71_13770 [Baekduia sp.]|jgi:hypothetical protein|nr:hypothetical protein [Baekduia sp.]